MSATDRRIEIDISIDQIEGQRDYQEDYAEAWRPRPDRVAGHFRPVLAVLADGMGGHVSGELASRIAVESYIQGYRARFVHNASDYVDPKWLSEALENANAAITQQIQADPSFDGMGCTLVAVWLTEEGLRWVSVGDSLLYHFSHETQTLVRLNEDHSYGALLDQQAARNIISDEEARLNPRRHALRSALTGQPIPISDLRSIGTEPLVIEPNDWLLIASDGLDTLAPSEIEEIMRVTSQSSAEELLHRLLGEVGDRGIANQDNTTIIAIRPYLSLASDPGAEPDLEDTIPLPNSAPREEPAAQQHAIQEQAEPDAQQGEEWPAPLDETDPASETPALEPTQRVAEPLDSAETEPVPARRASKIRSEVRPAEAKKSKLPIFGLAALFLATAAGAALWWAVETDQVRFVNGWPGIVAGPKAGPYEAPLPPGERDGASRHHPEFEN